MTEPAGEVETELLPGEPGSFDDFWREGLGCGLRWQILDVLCSQCNG